MAANDDDEWAGRAPELLADSRAMYRRALRLYRQHLAEGDRAMAKDDRLWLIAARHAIIEQRMILERPNVDEDNMPFLIEHWAEEEHAAAERDQDDG